MFTKKTIKDISINGKKILLRADYNVPVAPNGSIADDYRIEQSLPTLRYLLDQNCSVIICSHLGRPKGPADKSCSLAPVAKHLSKLLKQPVSFVNDCIGPEAEKAAKALKPGQVLLLENLRYHPEEEANDAAFAKQLAGLAEVFVQDGFGVVHRAHASTSAITKYLPAVSGLLLEKEVDTITNVMHKPQRPLMAIIGGAKIADKIDVISKFIEIADIVVIGGAMSNTFLLAQGVPMGKSLTDKNDLPLAKDILETARKKAAQGYFVFYIPQDGVAATKIDEKVHTRIVDWSAHVIADIEAYPKRPERLASQVRSDEMILDIGPFSGAFIAGSMQLTSTVVWNGTLGVAEEPALYGPVGPFAHGTELVVEALLGQFGHKPFSLVGGGDTVAYIEQRKMTNLFNHVSTGGGASLELMAGRKLPGVAALMDKK